MELSIREIGKVLKKSWIIILVIAILATAIGGAISIFVLEKKYTASAMVIVSSTSKSNAGNENMTINDYNLSTRLVNSYSVLCKSDRVLNQVIKDLGLNITTKKLAEMISVSAEKDTEIIRISVTSASPEFAQTVANTLVNVFKSEVSEIMQMDNVQVIDLAPLPTEPISPNVKVNTAIAGLLGLIVGLIIAFLRYMLDDTIKDSDVMTEILGAPVIGQVPKIA